MNIYSEELHVVCHLVTKAMADPRHLKPGGAVLSDAVEFVRSGDCFNAPSHIPYIIQ